MTELQSRVGLIRGVFPEVFGYQWEDFTSNPLRVSGLSDGAEGVQWNAWIEHETLAAFVGVNLEGKEYDGWPIARVITRELAKPQLLHVRDAMASVEGIHVYVGREVWQAGNRIKVPENVIDDMPVLLASLRSGTWRSALREADECLDDVSGTRKKAKQLVTLQDGRRLEREVSPQMQFYVKLTEWSAYPPRLREAMKSERARLEPLHQFLKKQASRLG
jgi:hypothetical protein